MTTHDLNVWPDSFLPLQDGTKLFDLRRDDRDYQVGDWLKLREWQPADIANAIPANFTGARCMRKIAYVLRAADVRIDGSDEPFNKASPFPLADGYVILGLCQPIIELPCLLFARRLFIEGTDQKVAAEAGKYLVDLTGFVQRTEEEVVAQKRRNK